MFEDEEEGTIEVALDNIHDIIEAFHQETPNFPIVEMYKFFMSNEIFNQEIPFEELVRRFNNFTQQKVSETLAELVKEGRAEIYFDDVSGEFVYANLPKNIFAKRRKRTK